jgi:NADH dehydrogenase
MAPDDLGIQSLARRKRVIVVGGGFGGLATARSLAKLDLDVVLIDRSNHHLFQPLLYQVATAVLTPADITMPIRGILRKQKNVRVVLGEVTQVDPGARRVALEGPWGHGDLGYDWLVLAAGARHSYFGHDAWERAAPGLKTIDDALDIRRRVFVAYECAEWTRDPEERRRQLTFVVVGAGPTGVEIAGALAEIARRTLIEDFRNIDSSEARVVLVEGSDAVLQSYPPPSCGPARASSWSRSASRSGSTPGSPTSTRAASCWAGPATPPASGSSRRRSSGPPACRRAASARSSDRNGTAPTA